MFNFTNEQKSMYGTPGQPMWGGGNNINNSMFGGMGFMNNQGSWQYNNYKAPNFGTPKFQQPSWAQNIIKDNKFLSSI